MRYAEALHSKHRGMSYLEVCFALLIMAMCLVPATSKLPDLLAGQRKIETKQALSFIAQGKLETAVLELGSNFAARDDAGDLSAEGHPNWRYHLTVTIQDAGATAVICSKAWADKNDDGDYDTDEPGVRFDTLAADLNWSP